MKKLFLLSVLVACAPAAVTEFPEIEGWRPETEVTSYDASSLWEFINGAAETFMQYGFQGLETAELSRDGTVVAVSIYDMGSALNAYGIYRSEFPDGAKPLAIGAQAMVSPPYQALMAKDRFYVKVDVYDGAMDGAAGRAMLETIAASLPGSDGMPDEFAALPKKGPGGRVGAIHSRGIPRSARARTLRVGRVRGRRHRVHRSAIRGIRCRCDLAGAVLQVEGYRC